MKKIVIALLVVAALATLGYIIVNVANPRTDGEAPTATQAPATTTEATAAQEPDSTPQEPASQTPTAVSPAGYRIVTIEDMRVRAMTQPLSSYSTSELNALPWNLRGTVQAVITSDISQAQVRPTLEAILNEVRASDGDLDEVTVFLYSEEANIGSGWDIGTALWAPEGQRSRVTPEIARSNDRTSYKIVTDERADVKAYLAARNETADRFGLTVDERRAFYQEMGKAELRALEDADRQVDPTVDIMANIRLSSELLEQYESEIRERFGLTKEEHAAISLEAFEKGWPLD